MEVYHDSAPAHRTDLGDFQLVCQRVIVSSRVSWEIHKEMASDKRNDPAISAK
jgi:hypothetical protein